MSHGLQGACQWQYFCFSGNLAYGLEIQGLELMAENTIKFNAFLEQ